MVITQILKRSNVCNWNRKHHAFLSLANPNLGWSKTVVFQWRAIKVDQRANVFSHFTNGARETTSTAIGNGMKERLVTRITCGKNGVQGFLLRDRVSNLHRVSKLISVRISEFSARKCRTMNSVATSFSTQHNNSVSRSHQTTNKFTRQNTNNAAIHQRISNIARIKPHTTIDGWNAHAVAVVAHACNNLAQNARGRQTTLGHMRVWWSNTKNISTRDRFSRKTRSHDIANTTTNTSRSPAVWFDRAWMIVGFNFHAQGVCVVKSNHASVVHKHAQTPINRAGFSGIHKRVRGSRNSVFQ